MAKKKKSLVESVLSEAKEALAPKAKKLGQVKSVYEDHPKFAKYKTGEK